MTAEIKTEPKVGIQRILIVDDHLMVRKGLAGILSTQADFEVAGEAKDGEQALWMYEQTQPDVVLMDLKMPGMDGVTATVKLRERHPEARIVALTSGDDMVQAALQAGAACCLLKTTRSEAIFNAIRGRCEGACDVAYHFSTSEISTAQPEGQTVTDIAPAWGSTLTAAERAVLVGLKDGLDDAEIGMRLLLSRSIVKFHISTLIAKLGVAHRSEAVTLAQSANASTSDK